MIVISNLHTRSGAHISFNGEILNSIKIAIDRGMTAVQIFLGNPKSIKRTTISDEDIACCNELIDRFPICVYSHFPYIANLAGSKNRLAWSGDSYQDEKTQKIIKSLEYELQVLSRLNTDTGVVIHPGNHVNKNDGLKTISNTINMIEFPGNSMLLLENCAGAGTGLATTFKEIKTIIDEIDLEKRDYVGVCVDTAHIYGVGEYDLSKAEEVERMFIEFDLIIGLDKFKLLHLNDSKVPLKSRKDRHAMLGTGYIWGDDFTSLIYLLQKCKELNIPLILETHSMDMFVLYELYEISQ